MTRRPLLAGALGALFALAPSAPPVLADDPATAPPAGGAATNVQDVPAIVQFKDRDVYRGGVRLEYGSRQKVPTQDATIVIDDHKPHRSGFIAVPDGIGTFTSRSGLAYTDTSFVDGTAYGSGTLVVPSAGNASGMTFTGVFVAGAPLYGSVRYTDGATYHGYLSGGCYAAPPATPPVAPADAPPDVFAKLPVGATTDVFTGSDGLTIAGTWHHVDGSPCSSGYVSGAHVTYPGGGAYAGDLDASGNYIGFGARYVHAPDADRLLCGTRPPGALYGPGTYRFTIGRFDVAGDDPHVWCDTPREGVTTMSVVVKSAGSSLSGYGDVHFASGDRASGPVKDGVLEGRGAYYPAAYPATVAGVFHNGRLGDPATIEACNVSYPATVGAGIVRNAPGSRRAYLFHGCDWIALGPGASLAAGAIPHGFGTEHLAGGETIAAMWDDGRPTGHVVVRVRRPYVATVDIANARAADERITGTATIRFDNGDVAQGTLNASVLEVSALEGPGEYRFASTGCTARGTFVHGKLRGSAVLVCPNEAPYAGVVGSDGTVQ
jgi:hypothetical protein